MGGRKKFTTEEFIERSKKIHGDKYDYSLVDYFTDKVKVKIICSEHGIFEQTPNHHCRGVGCPKCVGMYKNTEKVIGDFKKIHGDKYDYSLVEYKQSKLKIKIICPEHDVFYQTSNTHLAGHGCPKCFAKKLSKIYSHNTEKFIKKATKIHNDKYDYSTVIYKNSNNKVNIICKEHGEFEQLPSSHLTGKGCQKCGHNEMWSNRKNTTDYFIEKSIKIHGDKYDYSSTNYIKAINKVRIICKKHGEFEQTPNSHLGGAGCPKCGGTVKSNNIEFIEKSNKKHNFKYDYSLSNYKNSKTKIKIICPTHGIFEQEPSSHLNGAGCPKCVIPRLMLNNLHHNILGKGKFEERSHNAHNNKYDYSLVEYINCKLKVKIICPVHGIFEQIPDHHYRGVGCPMCAKQYGGKFSERDLYIFYDEKYNLMKIGISKNPERRIKDISKGQDKNGLILLKKYKNSALLESLLHKKYEQYRTEHTIYKEGKTEWFNLPKSEISNIEKFIRFCKLDSLDHKTTISF